MTVAGRRARGALLVALAIGVALVAVPARAGGVAAATAPAVGVTRTTVTVGGILSGNGAAVGADIGAQARLARANAHGGVAGRTIRYSGTAVDGGDPARDTAAVQQQSGSVFAVVPAVSSVLDASGLARARVPFFGAASTPGWEANRFGFGFVGAQAVLQTRVVSPAWGLQLRSLLGVAQGSLAALAVDNDAQGAALGDQARQSLRAAGFRTSTAVTLPAPPAALPDLAPVASTLATGAPAVVLLLTSPATVAGLARQLTLLGFTGTVATGDDAYQPTAPGFADGLTVLVPYAPFEQPTTANRRLAADVESFAHGTALTPGIAAGYWSADAFLAVLAKVGKHLTRDRFLAVANDNFSYAVSGTVGRSTWPPMHSQSVPCGALVQSDGSRYLVVEPYRCGESLVRRGRARSKAPSAGS